jgi:hypothetical protein
VAVVLGVDGAAWFDVVLGFAATAALSLVVVAGAELGAAVSASGAGAAASGGSGVLTKSFGCVVVAAPLEPPCIIFGPSMTAAIKTATVTIDPSAI